LIEEKVNEVLIPAIQKLHAEKGYIMSWTVSKSYRRLEEVSQNLIVRV
jgi:hypothetical protein